MVTLTVDTSDNKEIKIGLKINNKEYIENKKIGLNKTQIILPTINDLLKKHAVKLENLSAIEVNAGPGSFTGLRVGIAIANTLSFVLKIPVNGRKTGEIITPLY